MNLEKEMIKSVLWSLDFFVFYFLNKLIFTLLDRVPSNARIQNNCTMTQSSTLTYYLLFSKS